MRHRFEMEIVREGGILRALAIKGKPGCRSCTRETAKLEGLPVGVLDELNRTRAFYDSLAKMLWEKLEPETYPYEVVDGTLRMKATAGKSAGDSGA